MAEALLDVVIQGRGRVYIRDWSRIPTLILIRSPASLHPRFLNCVANHGNIVVTGRPEWNILIHGLLILTRGVQFRQDFLDFFSSDPDLNRVARSSCTFCGEIGVTFAQHFISRLTAAFTHGINLMANRLKSDVPERDLLLIMYLVQSSATPFIEMITFLVLCSYFISSPA
ncbi:hypothetical protein AVEN_90102-1 [Araneus ventricosus]|uniref:Uncharacterized protein n=1 Tax=Araneus ventricosus TaxID=182803 RepID=A0A4Y2VQR8_ARAVE|nr:hypothetical protein AVEN_90102-1 [Araneus ventricosus]